MSDCRKMAKPTWLQMQSHLVNATHIRDGMTESTRYGTWRKIFADSYIPISDVTEIEDGCVYVNAEHKGNIFDNSELINV